MGAIGYNAKCVNPYGWAGPSPAYEMHNDYLEAPWF